MDAASRRAAQPRYPRHVYPRPQKAVQATTRTRRRAGQLAAAPRARDLAAQLARRPATARASDHDVARLPTQTGRAATLI